MYLGDFAEDADIFFKFTSRAFATGIPGTLTSGVLSVYKDEGGAASEKTTAETYFDLDLDHDSITGWNNVRIDLSGDTFFATGADYSIVITTGTVDSVSVVGENIANFSIENRSMGQPAGATLATDVAALTSNLVIANSDTLAIEVKASDTHSRLVVVEAAIDSDQALDVTAVSNVHSRLVIVETAIDSDTASAATLAASAASSVEAIEAGGGSLTGAQDSKLTRVQSDMLLVEVKASDTHSRLVIVESSIDSDTASAATLALSAASSVEAIEAGGGSLTAAQDSKLTIIHSDSLVIEVKASDAHSRLVVVEAAADSDTASAATLALSAASSVEAIEAVGGALTGAQDSKLTIIHSDSLVIEVKASDTHSRLVVVESSIDSDTASAATLALSAASSVEAVEADLANATDGLGALEVITSNTHSHLVVVESAIDSDQTSRAAAISDTKSRLVVVESAIDSDQTSRATAISDVKSRLVIVESAIDSDQTSRTAAISDLDSALVVTDAVVDTIYSDTTVIERGAATIVAGTASGTPTTTTMPASGLTEATNDHFNGRVIIWTSGVLKDQATDITGYAGATKTFTFTAVTEAATAGDTFVIV